MRRRYSTLLALSSVVVTLAHHSPMQARTQSNHPPSPPGRMWVVNANVREFKPVDVRHHADMYRFVTRSLAMTRGEAPDVVLLQQVNLAATRWLQTAFTSRTGARFKAVKLPPAVVRIRRSGGAVVRNDSAILINASMVRAPTAGTFRVKQTRRTARHERIEQVIPWAEVVERGRSPLSLRMALTSIHFPTHHTFRSRKLSQQQKAQWSVKLHRQLADEMPDRGSGDGRVRVLAGDFNVRRCEPGTDSRWISDCRTNPFWTALESRGYRESLFVGNYLHTKPSTIDFMFSTGEISDVRWDHRYDPKGTSSYYSDHRVGASLLEDVDTTPPHKGRRPIYEKSDRNHPRITEWAWEGRAGWDGGSGKKAWLIYRRRLGEQMWERVAETPMGRWEDYDIDLAADEVFEYRITAIDREGNESRPTGILRVPRAR